MPATLPKAQPSPEINSLDSIRPRPAKADLRVNESQSSLTGIVSSVIRVTGSQKAAAADMGIDPAQLTRQLQSGHLTLARLEALGPDVLAELGKELVEQYAPLSDPKAHARKVCDEIQALVNTIRQFIEVA